MRVAHTPADLPRLSERMRTGVLSYSKARALTRVATPENEEKLADFALHGSASHVESLVRAWWRVDRLEAHGNEVDHGEERHRARELSVFPDEHGSFVIRGRLDPEVGAVLMRALEAAGDALGGRTKARTTGPRGRAAAIGLLAERALQAGFEVDGKIHGRADRFRVVLHVDAARSSAHDLCSESSEPELGAMLEDHQHVPAGTSKRLACDAGRVEMTHGSDGSVLDVGRKTRIVPPTIRRALDYRDGGCRFPGCGNRFCDAHHIKHWIDGGETRIDNLVLLCRRHHRAVHEGGFGVEVVEGGDHLGVSRVDGRAGRRWAATVRFRWPDGRPFPDAPGAPSLSSAGVRHDVDTQPPGDRCGSRDGDAPLEWRAVRCGLGGPRHVEPRNLGGKHRRPEAQEAHGYHPSICLATDTRTVTGAVIKARGATHLGDAETGGHRSYTSWKPRA